MTRARFRSARQPRPPLLGLLAEDLRTHGGNFAAPGFWAIATHRTTQRVEALPVPVLRRALRVPTRALSTAIDWVWKIRIDERTELGRRIRLAGTGMQIAAREIGDDVELQQGTTLGPLREADAGADASPVLAEGVELHSGASVLGRVTIGNHAVVLSNSLVLETVPAAATVLGVPANRVSLDDLPSELRSTREVASDVATPAGKRSAPEPSLWALLREDLATYESELWEGGLWAVALHRIEQRARDLRAPLVSAPARGVVRGLACAVGQLSGIRLSPQTRLGRRVRIWHMGNVDLRARSIGDDVHLRPNTTFGPAPGKPDVPEHWPAIGDRVDLGAGVCVLGRVRVGDDSVIGANTLLMNDVPANAAAVGVPGRVLPARASPTRPAGAGAAAQHDSGARDQNPKDIGLAELLAEDFRTHGSRLGSPGFWAVAVHRFGNWRMGVRAKPLRAPLTLIYHAAFQTIRWSWGIDLSYVVKLGRRVQLTHHGGVMLGAQSIGNDVIVRQAVVVGVVRRGALHAEKATIEDGVELGAHACVVGNVTIGRDTLVCANSVVALSVPPNSVVLGVPGRPVELAARLRAV